MVFYRDQKIITQKGVIIGEHIKSKKSYDIMEIVFKNLGAKIIGKILEGIFLEGGNFFVAKDDLCFSDIILRIKIEAAYYLMNNNLLGNRRFALVI